MTRRLITVRFVPVVSVLPVLLAASQAFAQATGQVAVSSGPGSTTRSLEGLQQLLLAPPEPQLNLFLTPKFSYEKFDEYSEDGETPALGSVPDLVESPEFNVTTLGVTAGADYLFANGFLLGASLSYNHADYEFDTESRETFADEAVATGDPLGFFLGDPLDRNFDEYGATVALGYLKDPWTVLLTGGYSRRDNIETLRREFGISTDEVVEVKGDTDSDVYSVELGVAYRFGSDNGASLQPLVSIGYQREEVDGYTEEADSRFTRGGFGEQFVAAGESPATSPIREFNDQTIESIPLQVGVLFSSPIGDPVADRTFDFSNIALGLSYTHDFEDQERNVEGRSINFPSDSVVYEEENRNQDFVSLTGALDFDVWIARGTLSFQHDRGFDERELANIVRLQIRVPVSL